ncbi:MAG: LLM class flavin-dependent oxidoreductase, partial [Phycisphaeraceae bacterium]|nr:LLM class flavin-dependent oxidoreductase [Phycisphaeraceae bacterium]
FEESIQIVRSLLDSDRTTFHGDFYDITDAPSDPKPVQETLPILVGTGSPRMLRITAQHAQDWNTWGVPELAADRRSVFAESCCAADTDPDSMHSCVQALIFMVDDQRAIDGIIAGEMGNRSIAGSDDHLVKQLRRYADDGFDEIIVPDFALGDTAEATRRVPAIQRRHRLPALNPTRHRRRVTERSVAGTSRRSLRRRHPEGRCSPSVRRDLPA